jgi:hypothetical protein
MGSVYGQPKPSIVLAAGVVVKTATNSTIVEKHGPPSLRDRIGAERFDERVKEIEGGSFYGVAITTLDRNELLYLAWTLWKQADDPS